MFALKAFASHSLFINNTPGVISAVGEISTKSLTYAREKGSYKSINSAEIELTTFTSMLNGLQFQLTTDIVDEIINIVKYIYNKAITIQGVVYRDEILQYLLTTYAATSFNFDSGNVVDNGRYFVPEWISWESKNTGNIGAGNVIKIWLSDPSFQLQYDDYEIVVVPPFVPLDNFFLPASMVNTQVNAVNMSAMINNIQIAKNNYPETIIRSESFNYIDPYNSLNTFPTVWNLLIYGEAGNNIDIIQNTLINYILANSTKLKADWTILLPDLFKRTEFSIVPDWTRWGIPNRALVTGIYSPITNLTNSLTLLNNTVKNYPTAHINANASVLPQAYKSLSLLIVGSPDNKNNAFKISDIFSDYINVPTSSADFNRMSTITQAWVTMIATMIVTAENMNPFSSVPSGMSKVTRNGILYLVSNYNNIDYLVAAKMSLPATV